MVKVQLSSLFFFLGGGGGESAYWNNLKTHANDNKTAVHSLEFEL